jgi:predicted ABC-type ATPase
VPLLTIVAGPNGSGKSTLLHKFEFEGRANLVEADAIAKRMCPENPASTAIPAAREAIQRTRDHLAARESFSVETTLSGTATCKTMREAKSLGYRVHLIFICLDAPERNILRVRERVTQGGHDVPAEDVLRRYQRSLANVPEAISLADQAFLFDNTGAQARKVLETRDGSVIWSLPGGTSEPAWVTRLRQALQ